MLSTDHERSCWFQDLKPEVVPNHMIVHLQGPKSSKTYYALLTLANLMSIYGAHIQGGHLYCLILMVVNQGGVDVKIIYDLEMRSRSDWNSMRSTGV
jgi:hypothetical protein